MHSGRHDKYIVIQTPTYTVSADTNDKYASAWSTYKSVWAERVHRQSTEVFEEGQLVVKDTHEWKIRYYDAPALKADMRISYDSEYYYIVGIKHLGRNDGLLITTIKRDN